MPAQLTAKVGGRLYLSMAASRTVLILSAFVTSSSIGKCVAEWENFIYGLCENLNLEVLPPNFFAVSSACLIFLSAAMTVQPSCANRMAVARPIPLPAPD
jgi:hypothetical protein